MGEVDLLQFDVLVLHGILERLDRLGVAPGGQNRSI